MSGWQMHSWCNDCDSVLLRALSFLTFLLNVSIQNVLFSHIWVYTCRCYKNNILRNTGCYRLKTELRLQSRALIFHQHVCVFVSVKDIEVMHSACCLLINSCAGHKSSHFISQDFPTFISAKFIVVSFFVYDGKVKVSVR